MVVTLFMFDPKSGKQTGKTREVQVEIEDYKKLSPREFWGALGESSPLAGTFWPPNSDSDIFDGFGWIAAELMTPQEMVSGLTSGVIPPTYPIEHGKVVPVANLLMDLIQKKVKFISPYSEEERSTWPQQIAEAQKIIEGEEGQTPMLSSIAEAEGRSLEELALSVQAKAKAYEEAQIEFVTKFNLVRKRISELQLQLADKKKHLHVIEELIALAK